jgi:hypothetical protein
MTGHDPLAARSRLLRRATTSATALAVAAAAGTGLLTFKIAQDHAAATEQSGNRSGSPTSGTTRSGSARSSGSTVGGSGLGGSTQAQQQIPSGGSNGS